MSGKFYGQSYTNNTQVSVIIYLTQFLILMCRCCPELFESPSKTGRGHGPMDTCMDTYSTIFFHIAVVEWRCTVRLRLYINVNYSNCWVGNSNVTTCTADVTVPQGVVGSWMRGSYRATTTANKLHPVIS